MKKRKPGILLSFLVFIGLISTMSIGVIVFKMDVISLLFIVLVLITMVSMTLGYSLDDLLQAMSKSLYKSAVSLVFFLIIGILIAAWINSGTVPALIYYGLKLIHPNIFLPVGFIVLSITSFSTGTSWGTIGTLGVALMGMGVSIGIPLPILAGMILSGSVFGDYLSPMSDTTILASGNAKVEIYDHVKSMMITAIPSFIVVVVIYGIIGLQYNGSYNSESINLITTAISINFKVGYISLVPMIVVIILSIFKVKSIPTLLIGVGLGIIIAVFYQGFTLTSVINSLYSGFSLTTDNQIVNTLINRGGMASMSWTFILAFIALLLSGVLEEVGYIKVLIYGVISKIKTVGTLSLTTYLTSILGVAAMAEVYLSIIMNASLYRDVYDEMGVNKNILSKMLEQGGTLSGFLIPWSTSGAFAIGTLGVQTVDYLPFALFLWITPIITITLTYLNIGIGVKKQRK